MLNLLKNIIYRIDWKLSFITVLELFLALAIYPMVLYADPSWFTEDGVVENLQLLILLLAVFIAFKSKYNRPLFIVAAMIIILLIMRETNMGRSYFCAKYLSADEICKWHNFKYGYLIDWIRMAFVCCMLIYGTIYKIWTPAWNYIVKAPIYIWEFFFMIVGFIGGTLSEMPQFDSETSEECFEILFYIALTYALYRYTKYNLK